MKMSTDEQMLEVMQQTLSKIEELNTRLGMIEKDLTSMDRLQTMVSYYVKEIEHVAENNNIMG